MGVFPAISYLNCIVLDGKPPILHYSLVRIATFFHANGLDHLIVRTCVFLAWQMSVCRPLWKPLKKLNSSGNTFWLRCGQIHIAGWISSQKALGCDRPSFHEELDAFHDERHSRKQYFYLEFEAKLIEIQVNDDLLKPIVIGDCPLATVKEIQLKEIERPSGLVLIQPFSHSNEVESVAACRRYLLDEPIRRRRRSSG
jgi:hypothetical protein